MRNIFIIAIAIFAAAISDLAVTQIATPIAKPYKLLLFSTATYTGYEPRDGKICQTSMEVAVDTFNSRKDLLTDYNVEVSYRDEGSGAKLAPKNYIGFLRDAEERGREEANTFLAPAIVGTAQGCHTVTNIARAMNMVQFTPGCSGEQFTANRRLYPNLYRNRVPADLQYIPPLIFFFNSKAKWNQIGVINFDSGTKVQQAVARAGRQLVYSTLVQGIDDAMMKDLKKSDARIVMVQTGSVSVYTAFLCLAYNYGIREPTHVFMTASSNFIDPYASDLSLPTGCTRKMFLEQVKSTFWGGPFDFALENHGITNFGYDLAGFEVQLDKLTNNSRSADYVRRHRCFDAMAQTLLSLDGGDRLLKRHHNLSLKDFKREQSLVLQAVNNSAAKTDFIGLRIGRFHYSKRLELDGEAQYLTQWVDGQMRIIYTVFFNGSDSASLTDLTQYGYTEVNDPIWSTRDGLPPKDLSAVHHRQDTFSVAAFSILVVLACFGFGFVAFFTWLVVKRHQQLSPTQTKALVVDTMPIAGWGLCMIAAIIIGTSSNTCIIQSILSVFGLALVDSTVVFKMFAFLRRLQKASNEIVNKWQLTGIAAFIACNLAIAIAMMAYDPAFMAKDVDPPFYDEQMDWYEDNTRFYCTSNYFFAWTASLAAIHLFLLIFAAFLAYEVRHAVISPTLELDHKTTRLACINAVTMFAAIFFLLFVIPTDQTTLKATILAFGLLFFSSSCSTILLFPVSLKWREKIRLACFEAHRDIHIIV